MNLGLAIADFTWPDRSEPLARTLRRTAVTAEDVGFTRLAVMDHLWQIGTVRGAERSEPLELMGELVIPEAARFGVRDGDDATPDAESEVTDTMSDVMIDPEAGLRPTMLGRDRQRGY
jgi:hypothetical protein